LSVRPIHSCAGKRYRFVLPLPVCLVGLAAGATPADSAAKNLNTADRVVMKPVGDFTAPSVTPFLRLMPAIGDGGVESLAPPALRGRRAWVWA
jgi:hypothetical protein